jgi:phage terminase large subunit-like protein
MTTTPAIRAKRTAPEGLPERTLGWQVLQWTADYLLQPDGPNAGEPWRFTPEQARFVLWWYAIDERGRFLYRYGMFRRMKGHGKDPLGAALCCVEFIGPCRFGGWKPNGEPKVTPHSAAWIQTAAVSRDQTRNTMTLFPGMISRKAIEEYSVEIGKEIIYAHQGRCRIEAVTSSARSLEGQRTSFTLKNETHHWHKNNEGHDMSAAIARNAAKSRDGSSRVLAISNAHGLGEDSDAERDHTAFRSGKAADTLYDSLEAPEGLDLDNDDDLREGLLAARGDSDWLDVDRLMSEIRDPRTTESVARRFYLNQIHASDERAFDMAAWSRNVREPHQVVNGVVQSTYMPAAGALITLGFDGSRGEDATAIVGTEVSTGFQWLAGLWEKPPNRPDWEVSRAEVDARIRELKATYNVWRLTGDKWDWDETFDRWRGDFGKNSRNEDVVIPYPQNAQRQAAMIMPYADAIANGDLTHSGDPRYTRHVGNAIRKAVAGPSEDGFPLWRIYKEHWQSPNKIDAAQAGGMSWHGRLSAIAAGVLNETQSDPGTAGIPGVWV